MISRTIYNFLKTSTKEKVFTRFSSKNSENVQQSHLTLCNVVNGIGKIVLNNPLKRNALSLAMLKSIENGLMENVVKKSHVVIISANGTVFSSGHDLKELINTADSSHHKEIFDKCSEVMSLIQDIPIPVIAQVKGLATAAGCQLVASCDMAVAATNAMFATPGVNIGLFCSTPAVAVSRAVPHKIAMEMLFTGQPIFAKDALQYGLVNKVVPEEKLEEVTLNLAQQICKTSQPVVAMGKKCYYQQITQNRNDAYRIAGQVMVDNLKLKDGNEGIEAFLNKRKPLWTHEE
ncbi:enoyl-CoA hydratase domain-containing protein 3, mitochondrial-like isoform X1 [Xenia sp. Carnegie-2017]|uniref:enoyl-CoA hydratase domain-containing protein 3, mitochondrial-like isoform X1 n=1 Tax=Xenia sp. Carnegie-2017 TaxID=2897299 RepID=UPI001F034100|nr:enoyl-CoA hydratase domain-containing protein 3, mitochondrial-like isoform X1 [Xenia sp. Carnegie-2017]